MPKDEWLRDRNRQFGRFANSYDGPEFSPPLSSTRDLLNVLRNRTTKHFQDKIPEFRSLPKYGDQNAIKLLAYAFESENIPEITHLPALVSALGPPAIDELCRLMSLHISHAEPEGLLKILGLLQRISLSLSQLALWEIERASGLQNPDIRQVAQGLLDRIRVYAPPQQSKPNQMQQVHEEQETRLNSPQSPESVQSSNPLSRTRRLLLGEWVRRNSDEPLIFMSNDTLVRGTVFVGKVRLKTTNEIEIVSASGDVIERWVITKLTVDGLILKDCEHTHTCYYRSSTISLS